MVYAAPPPAQAAFSLADPSPALHHARPAHRRTRSHTFNQESASSSTGFHTAAPPLPRHRSTKKAFYLEEDGNSSPEPVEDGPEPILSPLLINTDVPNFPSFAAAAAATTTQSIPFPRSDGPASPDVSSPRPSFSRTPSSSGIRHNGKPLKSSLKSASAPNIPDELRYHLRARSEPSTPSAKSVHFREEDDLEEVRVYNRGGRPANLLNKPAEETETETEAEGAFPFPRTVMSPVSPSGVPPPSPTLAFEIDFAPSQTSSVPRPNPDLYANVFLESLSLPKTRPAALRGSVLVRNVAFEKNIALRFTFDDWQTTSEVFCKHVVSLPGLPPPFPRPNTVGDAVGMLATNGPSQAGWDRFSFQISLEDYATKLAERTLYLVARYTSPGVGEWWDNNGGQNYRVRFKRSSAPVPVAPAPTTTTERQAAPVVQQSGFVMPNTVRLTPHTNGAPAAIPIPSPALAQPKPTPAQQYAASIMKGRPVFGSPAASPRGSPRGSPTHAGSPRTSPNGSPNGSDSEAARKRPARQKPNMGLGLGLGLGLNPHAQDSPVKSTPLPVRPPTMTRSNSSPPVYSPSSQADTIGSFLASADMSSRPSPLAREVDPLMARLSKLTMRNYASPGRSRACSVDENDKPGEHTVQLKPATPPPPAVVEEEDIVQQHQHQSDSHLNAPSSSPVMSSNDHSPMDGGSAASSANSSAASSPLPGTPSMLSLSELPGFDWNKPASTGKHTPTSDTPGGSGSDSDASKSSASTIQQRRLAMPRTTDIVLNMPSPTSRGAIDSPFSPISTPRFHIGEPKAMFSPEASGDLLSPARARVGDADYAAFVRQWCFARSPSPGHGTPLGEGIPVAGASPPGDLPGPLQPAASTPTAVTVQVRLRNGSPTHTPPQGSAEGTPLGGSSDRAGWLGIGDSYGFNMGVGMQAGKA